VKRFKPVFKYGLKVNDLDLTADELEAALGGSDSGSTVTGITAHAGGGQQASEALGVNSINQVTVIATDGDSVTLPAAAAGVTVLVINADASGSNTLAVFPYTGDTINGGSANASISVPAATTVRFTAVNATSWYSSTVAGTAGTAAAGAAVVLDSSKDVTGIRNLTTTGAIVGGTSVNAGVSSTAPTVNAGTNGGASAGTVKIWNTTESRGYTTLTATANTGNTETNINTAAQAGARTYGIPDWSTKASEDTECSLAGIKVVADTTNRPGALGCLLYATGNDKLYVCTTASATAATWTIVGSQS
jgi:hypothetical protein